MNYDNLIISLFYTNRKTKQISNKINTNIVKKFRNKINKYKNIISFLENRFIENDKDFIETIWRLKYNVYSMPLCPVCGNPVHIFEIKFNKPNFRVCCSVECSKKYSIIQAQNTMVKKYGGKSPYCSKEIQEKAKSTCIERYGVPYSLMSREIRYKGQNTNLIKYGSISPAANKDIKEKIKNTNKIKYGVEYPLQNKRIFDLTKKTLLERYNTDKVGSINFVRNKIKNTFLNKYGVDHNWKSEIVQNNQKQTMYIKYHVFNVFELPEVIKYSHSKEIIDKADKTRIKNKTYTTSKAENEIYEYIKEKFPDVIRQYKEDRYPWKCDFYIPCIDYFIEYQGFYTHGNHPFNENNELDIERLNKLKTKYIGFYNIYHRWPSIITGWSISDVKKRNKAKENNLNFVEFYNVQDAKKFIDYIYGMYKK